MVAPHGYILRTNFSFHGRVNEGMGYIRYQNAEHLFAKAAAAGMLTPEWIYSNVSRSFYHSLLETDLVLDPPANGWFIDQDFIPRNSSSASVIVHGVKPGNDPSLTTMWCLLGYPPCSVAFPVWERMASDIPYMLTVASGQQNAPMCEMAVQLKNKVFPITRGSGKRYMHFALLYNDQGNGIMQMLAPVEKQTFRYAKELTALMERTGFSASAIRDFYKGTESQFEMIREGLTEFYDL